MRSSVARAVLVGMSMFLALPLLEGALWATGQYAPPSMDPGTQDIYEFDPHVGYRLRPLLKTEQRYPADSPEVIPIVANSDGFRGRREFGQADDRFRVLVVGDSFVFGQGVREDDRLTEQMERLEPRWRVDNMGMTGWGPDLMVRAIERYGGKIRPEVVVLAIYTDDFRRLVPYYAGVGYRYPKFELAGSELVDVPFPPQTIWDRLRLVQWQRQMTWNDPAVRNRYDLNEALLERYLHDASAMRFAPMVAFFPGTGDNAEDQARRGFLLTWATRRKVPYVDLTETMQGAGIDTVFIPKNWHWNRAGHRLAAEQLVKLVASRPQ